MARLQAQGSWPCRHAPLHINFHLLRSSYCMHSSASTITLSSSVQPRLLAVQVMDVIFTRSRAFRQLVSNSFSDFLDLAVCYKPDASLPAGPGQELREKSLEIVERWHEQFGKFYPEVHTTVQQYSSSHTVLLCAWMQNCLAQPAVTPSCCRPACIAVYSCALHGAPGSIQCTC